MGSCYGGMSTRLKQHVVTEFLSAENVTPAEIHHRLQAVYGENTVNRTTVNRWAIKFRECEPGRANIVDQPRSGRHDRIFGSWEYCQFSSVHWNNKKPTAEFGSTVVDSNVLVTGKAELVSFGVVVGRDRLVTVATQYELDRLVNKSRWRRDFLCRPDRPRNLPCFVYYGYRVYPEDDAAGTWPTPYSAEVKEIWALHLYSLSGLSCPVTRRIYHLGF